MNGGYNWSRADTTCTGPAPFCLLPSSGGGTATTTGGLRAALADFNALFVNAYSPNVDGGVIGGHIGRNWQNGHWVWGLEADLDWSRERASLTNVATLNTVSVGNFLSLGHPHERLALNWFGSGRVRAGFAQDTWLLYVTGGFAVGRMSYSATITQFSTTTSPGGIVLASGSDFSAAASESVTRFGGAVGAGIERAFTSNLIARIEYLYLDFGARTFFAGRQEPPDHRPPA